MEKFLEELRRALEEAKVENVEDIMATYLEHFALGHEAGMSDEEIIERFDRIEDIVWQSNKKNENQEGYNLILDLGYFSDFKIKYTNTCGPSEIQFDIDENAFKYVELIREGNNIHLKEKDKMNMLGKNKNHFDGVMYMGSNVKFNEVKINNISCDLWFDTKIRCQSFNLNNVSGDVTNIKVQASNGIVVSNTSCDLEFEYYEAPKSRISSVSGDIKIDEYICDSSKISVVSGDIVIKHGTKAEYQISTVSGDVSILEGADGSSMKTTTLSGQIKVSGTIVSKTMAETISNHFKNSFKL